MESNSGPWGFYSSENMKEWVFESCVEQDKWGDELCGCVDFFQLAVDGDPRNKKWVMILIDGSYIVGTFDGRSRRHKRPSLRRLRRYLCGRAVKRETPGAPGPGSGGAASGRDSATATRPIT